ncbi:Hypothetical_protein [Hexamita inflata]|uniref:Hypothetical_protein n=1 Tax=Hexamita inflata TaxID=28002 RepID=A0AA86UP85_9EUKA|nr:Hypothetical protein HINF_LOCUS46621 [Hexamita inflata]
MYQKSEPIYIFKILFLQKSLISTIFWILNHTLHDLVIGIIQNGGQLEPFRCVFKLQSGQEFDMGMTVEQANVMNRYLYFLLPYHRRRQNMVTKITNPAYFQ